MHQCARADGARLSSGGNRRSRRGALVDFRERLIRTDMNRRLLERTANWREKRAGSIGASCSNLSASRWIAQPLEGAGRVEDTFNLLGHAARRRSRVRHVCCAGVRRPWPSGAGVEVLLMPSVKAALGGDWSNPAEKSRTLKVLVSQLGRTGELDRVAPPRECQAVVEPHLATLRQVRAQDLAGNMASGPRIRDGVAHDRRRLNRGTPRCRRCHKGCGLRVRWI